MEKHTLWSTMLASFGVLHYVFVPEAHKTWCCLTRTRINKQIAFSTQVCFAFWAILQSSPRLQSQKWGRQGGGTRHHPGPLLSLLFALLLFQEHNRRLCYAMSFLKKQLFGGNQHNLVFLCHLKTVFYLKQLSLIITHPHVSSMDPPVYTVKSFC